MTPINCVSGNACVIRFFWSPCPPPTSITCIRGWYLCMEFRTTCKNGEKKCYWMAIIDVVQTHITAQQGFFSKKSNFKNFLFCYTMSTCIQVTWLFVWFTIANKHKNKKMWYDLKRQLSTKISNDVGLYLIR